MTDSVFSTTSFASVIAATFGPQVIALQNRKAPLLSVLPKRPLASNSFNWTMETSGSTASIIEEAADFPASASDALIKATAATSIFSSTFKMSDLAMKIAALGTSPNVAEFTRQLRNSVGNLMGGSTGIDPYLFTGTGTDEPFGLLTIVETGNTVYGINQASAGNALFRGNVVSGSDGYLTFDMIDEGFEKVFKATGSKPDLIVCSAKTGRHIAKLGLAYKALMGTIQSIQTAAGVVDPGYTMASVNGVPLLLDQHCPDGYILGLNTEVCYGGYLPQTTNLGMGEAFIIDAALDPRSGVSSLPMTLTPLARTATAMKFGLQLDFAFIVENPQYCFKIHEFTYDE